MVDAQDGSSRKVLGTDDLFEIYDLEWSPDGSQLAVLNHPVVPPTAGLLTMAPDGSDVRLVALCENGKDRDRLCPSNGGGVAWSSEGRELAFRNYDGRRAALSLLRIGERACLCPRTSPSPLRVDPGKRRPPRRASLRATCRRFP